MRLMIFLKGDSKKARIRIESIVEGGMSYGTGEEKQIEFKAKLYCT